MISENKIKGNFKWKSVYNTNIKLFNCLLLDYIKVENNQFNTNIKIDEPSIEIIKNIEIKLRNELIKENCFLKSLVSNNNNIIQIRLHVIKKQIKTSIINNQLENIDYSELKPNSLVDIEFEIESLWCHRNYYPNFCYKLRPILIQVNQ